MNMRGDFRIASTSGCCGAGRVRPSQRVQPGWRRGRPVPACLGERGQDLDQRGALPLVAALEFLNGTLAAFATPALRGFVPQLVGKARIREANALLGSVRNATKILGPSLSGPSRIGPGSGRQLSCTGR
ncbi:hypothetical protein [Streptomyces sp. NPDC059008]|uniref:hypothetical protein n=1 Tax=Streptomyces sp. NPDC059008 TaxID=3346693 RepID=UPI003687465E